MADSLRELTAALEQFAIDRDWRPFHSPKNLASALIVEAAELLEHFQWLTEDQSRQLDAAKREAVGAEMADVLLYLLQLSTSLNIDLVAAAQEKIKANAAKYPVDLARGTSRKSDELL